MAAYFLNKSATIKKLLKSGEAPPLIGFNAYIHPIFPQLHGVGFEVIAFAAAVKAGGRVKPVTVQRTNNLAERINPALVHFPAGMRASGRAGTHLLLIDTDA